MPNIIGLLPDGRVAADVRTVFRMNAVATLWHFRRREVENGPVPFASLVSLIHRDQLEANDLVREDWNPEWRPAAEAVGLFHMAGRQDLMEKWEAEQAERERLAREVAAADEVDRVGEAAEADVGELDSTAGDLGDSSRSDVERSDVDADADWSETVAAAIQAQDQRREALGEVVGGDTMQSQPGWFGRLLGRVFARRAARGLSDVADAGVTGGLRLLQSRWVQGALVLVALGLTTWLVILPRIPINSAAALGEYQETLGLLTDAREASDRGAVDWAGLNQRVSALGGLKLERVRQAASSRSPELLDLQRVGELLPKVLEEVRQPSDEPGPAERKAAIHLAAAAKEVELQREIANRRQGVARPGAAESTTDRLVFWGLGIVDILLLAWFGRWAYRWWKQRRSIAVRI